MATTKKTTVKKAPLKKAAPRAKKAPEITAGKGEAVVYGMDGFNHLSHSYHEWVMAGSTKAEFCSNLFGTREELVMIDIEASQSSHHIGIPLVLRILGSGVRDTEFISYLEVITHGRNTSVC